MQNNLYTSNSRIKRFLKGLLVLFVAVLVLRYVDHALRFKYGDGITAMETFYELEENSVDVLVLGSSHSFEDINPAVLYEEYGMASYVLASSVQPLWNTYYYLKEALKTQTPELIVLECWCTLYTQEYSKPSYVIKSTHGMKWSVDKWNAIKVSVNEEELFTYIPEFLRYHNRYEELTMADFLPYQGREAYYSSWKGHGDNMTVTEFDDPMFSEPTQGIVLHEKVEQYYRMIIELAQSEGIPICIVVSPCAELQKEQQERLYSAKLIAEEYGVIFKDFNYCADEIGLNYAEDFADLDHLNYKGNEKYTSYLGAFLKDNFLISDRHENPDYISWENNVIIRKHNLDNHELPLVQDVNEYEKKLAQLMETEEYYIICTSRLENTYGEQRVLYKGTEVVYDSKTDGGELVYELSKWNTLYLDGTTSIKINNIEYGLTETGYNLVVYDKLLDKIVDVVAIEESAETVRR